MGWTAPWTAVAGTVVTADNWNTYIRDNQRYLKGIGQVPTIESGLTIDNTDGDERLLLPLLSTAECATVLNAEGEVAFDEQTHRIKYYDNNSVVSVVGTDDVSSTPTDSASTTPISSDWAYDHLNILTTAGDIVYATGARVWDRLGIGTANQLLVVNSGATAPEWGSALGGTLDWVQSGNTSAGSTYYLSKSSGSPGGNETVDKIFVCPRIGIIANLYVILSAAPGAGKNLVLTVRKNGADQTLTCTISEAATTGNDTAHTFNVAAGDYLSISAVLDAAATVQLVSASITYA